MPQLQLPIFPAGVTETNSQIAVEKKAGTVYYLYGHLPVFHHGEDDVHGFRMFTSQMIVNGTVKPKEIVRNSSDVLSGFGKKRRHRQAAPIRNDGLGKIS